EPVGGVSARTAQLGPRGSTRATGRPAREPRIAWRVHVVGIAGLIQTYGHRIDQTARSQTQRRDHPCPEILPLVHAVFRTAQRRHVRVASEGLLGALDLVAAI